jgi:hypothetical protein
MRVSAEFLRWTRRQAEVEQRSNLHRLDQAHGVAYLAGLPDSERAAKELLAWGERHLGELGDGEHFPIEYSVSKDTMCFLDGECVILEPPNVGHDAT